MKKAAWLPWYVFGLALLTVSLPVTRGATLSDELPASVVERVAELRRSFPGMVLGDMAGEVKRHHGPIDGIVAYGRSSEADRDILADRLLLDLLCFSERFKPGVREPRLDDTALAHSYWVGQEPEHGISIDALLLLELADPARSLGLTKKALSAIYDAAQSMSYLTECRNLKWHPEDAKEVAREKREFGGGSTTGAELAWCCERFMVRGHASGALASLPGAQRVVLDYRRWRKVTMLELGASKGLEIPYLPRDYQEWTMEYVKKLVEALPSVPSPPSHASAGEPVQDMRDVLTAFLQAQVAGDYDTVYALLHPVAKSQESLGKYRERAARVFRPYGRLAGFKIDEIVFSTDFALVVDVPANRPVNRSGSGPSVVRGVARWIRQDGRWQMFSPPWDSFYGRDKLPPIALRALDGPAEPVWSPDRGPIPGCPDIEGLNGALHRFIEALVASDNPALYEMLASPAKARISFANFDESLKRLRSEWLKPARLYSLARPELQALVTLECKPTDEMRSSLQKCGLKPVRDDVWPLWYRPILRSHEGKWYIWRAF